MTICVRTDDDVRELARDYANLPQDAVKTIEEVHREGGKILSFLSYCGGLPAPENSGNPLGYKFSWSPRGVLLALRNAARFYEDGKIVDVAGPGKRLSRLSGRGK